MIHINYLPAPYSKFVKYTLYMYVFLYKHLIQNAQA